MNKSTLISALFVAVALAACSKQESAAPTASAAAAAPAASAAQGSPGVSIEAIQSQGQGFTVGSPMSARVVYVFFDAQCPHCSALWYAAKPLKGQAKFVWLPVRLLNDNSETQGAAILAGKDPIATMDEHEASLMDRKGGIKVEGDVAAQRAQVKKNTELFNQLNFQSVPSMVTKNSQSGAVVTHEGALTTPDLAVFLGVPVPAQ